MQKVDVDGCTLNVYQEGEGEPLLFIHGFPLDHTMWEKQLEAFSGQCEVIAPDLRGFGESEMGDSSDFSMAHLADDLAKMLDSIWVYGEVTVVALSMGGYVAFEFWRRHEQRVKQFILCDTRATSDEPTVATKRLEIAERVMEDGPEFLADEMLPKLFSEQTRENQPEIVEATRKVILNTKPDTIATAQKAMAERLDVSVMLPTINVPTLVVCGEHDEITPPTEMREMARQIPDAQFLEIAGTGHLSPLEDPTTFNASLGRLVATEE